MSMVSFARLIVITQNTDPFVDQSQPIFEGMQTAG